jgi:methylmalonyl-CoA/ethylmalonyl-CoA epimerase
MNFDHIGLVVKDIQDANTLFQRDFPGFEASKIIHDAAIDVKVQFLTYSKSNRIELIEPLSEASPIRTALKNKSTSSIHHLAYSCKNIDETCTNLREQGYGFLTKFYYAKAFNGSRVIFLLSPLNFIIELIESND